MTELFRKSFPVRWGDVDLNGHMGNSAYLDLATDVRMLFFAEHGFPMRRFRELGIGPVAQRDEMEYFRELRLLDEVTVTLALAGLSSDAARFRLRNDFLSADGRAAARVTSDGGWLDLAARKLAPPPKELADTLLAMVRTPDFGEIPPRRSGGI